MPTSQQDADGLSLHVVLMATENWRVGHNGGMPWTLPNEIKRISALTSITENSGAQNAIILGKNTFLSIPAEYRPLDGRLNVVLSRTTSLRKDHNISDDVLIATSLDSALQQLTDKAAKGSIERVFVLGGRRAFQAALEAPQCDSVYVTRILGKREAGYSETVPAIDESAFVLVEEDQEREEDGWRYKHQKYERGGTKRTVITTRTTTTKTTVTQGGDDDDDDDYDDDFEDESRGGTAKSARRPAPAKATATASSASAKRSPRRKQATHKSSVGKEASVASRRSKGSTARSRRSGGGRSARGGSTYRSGGSTARSGGGDRDDMIPTPPPRLMGELQPVGPRVRVHPSLPGPGAYDADRGIGSQHEKSTNATASSWSFGTSSRDDYTRQYLSREQQARMPSRNTVDVDFMQEEKAVLKQSSVTSQPSYSFTRSTRESYNRTYTDKEHVKGMTFDTTSNVDYMPGSSLTQIGGSTTVGSAANAPSSSFGTAPRDAYLHQFLSKEMQSTMQRLDEGMQTVEIDATGKQIQSSKATAPSWGFGTSDRDRRNKLALVKEYSSKKSSSSRKGTRVTKKSSTRKVVKKKSTSRKRSKSSRVRRQAKRPAAKLSTNGDVVSKSPRPSPRTTRLAAREQVAQSGSRKGSWFSKGGMRYTTREVAMEYGTIRSPRTRIVKKGATMAGGSGSRAFQSGRSYKVSSGFRGYPAMPPPAAPAQRAAASAEIWV